MTRPEYPYPLSFVVFWIIVAATLFAIGCTMVLDPKSPAWVGLVSITAALVPFWGAGYVFAKRQHQLQLMKIYSLNIELSYVLRTNSFPDIDLITLSNLMDDKNEDFILRKVLRANWDMEQMMEALHEWKLDQEEARWTRAREIADSKAVGM